MMQRTMTNTPPDWVLYEAGKLSNYDELDISQLRYEYDRYAYSFRALCDMIQKYEQPPVDRKLLCAREAVRLHNERHVFSHNLLTPEDVCVRAIELWESGYGKG